MQYSVRFRWILGFLVLWLMSGCNDWEITILSDYQLTIKTDGKINNIPYKYQDSGGLVKSDSTIASNGNAGNICRVPPTTALESCTGGASCVRFGSTFGMCLNRCTTYGTTEGCYAPYGKLSLCLLKDPNTNILACGYICKDSTTNTSYETPGLAEQYKCGSVLGVESMTFWMPNM